MPNGPALRCKNKVKMHTFNLHMGVLVQLWGLKQCGNLEH